MKKFFFMLFMMLGIMVARAEIYEYNVIAINERNTEHTRQWQGWSYPAGYSIGVYTNLEKIVYYRYGETRQEYYIVSVESGTVDGCSALIIYTINDNGLRCTLYEYSKDGYVYLWITYRDHEFLYQMQ